MFLPHITFSLYINLPKMFVIYARILCWDQYAGRSDAQAVKGTQSEKSSDRELHGTLDFDASWEVVERSFGLLEGMNPKVNYLFTFLYGLFPLNFMNFIRKPRQYLKMKSFPGADELTLYEDMIRRRSEIHRVVHKLHPNFFTTTPEDELTDNRLLKIGPADIVSECLGLCIAVANSLSDPGPPPTSKLPLIPKTLRSHKSTPKALLSSYPDDCQLTSGAPSLTTEFGAHMGSWRHTHSITLTAISTKKGFISGHKEAKARPHKSGSTLEDNRHSDFSRLQIFAQGLLRSPVSQPNSPGTETYNTAILQLEVMLLTNDLNFERFQKAQYIAQIAELQRKHNRTLQEKTKRTDVHYAQFQTEIASNCSHAKNHEVQPTKKVKPFREGAKKWRQDLEARLREYELREQEAERIKKNHEFLRRELQSVKSNLDSRDAELDCIKKTFEQKISMLENQLRIAQQTSAQSENLALSVQMMNSAMVASQPRMLALEKNYNILQETYLDLEIRCGELEMRQRNNPSSHRPSSVLSLTQYADDNMRVPHVSGSRGSENRSRISSTQRLHDFSNSLLPVDDEDAPSWSVRSSDRYPERPQRFKSFASARLPRERGTSRVCNHRVFIGPDDIDE